MNAKTAIKKMQNAGATIKEVAITESTRRIVATFPTGRVCTFDPDWKTGEVTAFAFPYAYDDADQTELCFFRYSIKSAIEKGLS